MSNATRQFHRRWAMRDGISWADVMGRSRRRKRHAEEPVKFDVVRDDRFGRKKARQGGAVAALLSLASIFGFNRRKT